jgi:hypothetical protein
MCGLCTCTGRAACRHAGKVMQLVLCCSTASTKQHWDRCLRVADQLASSCCCYSLQLCWYTCLRYVAHACMLSVLLRSPGRVKCSHPQPCTSGALLCALQCRHSRTPSPAAAKHNQSMAKR